MDSMQTFGSWQIILLENDKVGNDGDVLTRVGANDAAFLPAAGGGSSAWGDITGTLANQTDLQAALDAKAEAGAAVVFESVSGPENTPLDIPFGQVTDGDARFNDDLNMAGGGLNIWQDSDIRIELVEGSGVFHSLIRTASEVVIIGAAGYPLEIHSPTRFTSPIIITDLNSDDGSAITHINLNPTDELRINGNPTLTEDVVIPGVGTLSLFKGLATGWTPV